MEFFDLHFWIQMLTAVLGTLGFSLIFRVRPRHLPYAAVGGLLTYFVYYLLEWNGMNLLLAAFLSSAVGAVWSEGCARLRHAPAIVFMLPCIIPTVPGGSLYRTMNALLSKDYPSLYNHQGGTLSVGLGIAGGIVAVSVLMAIGSTLIDVIKQRITKKN